MKCPNPSCKKPIIFSIYDIEKCKSCPSCGMIFVNHFEMLDFLDKEVNLFTIFGLFVAIVTILPTYLHGGTPFQNSSTHIFYQPPPEIISNLLNILTNFFIIACGFIVLLMGTAIVSDLFGDSRQREIVLFENRFFTFRKEDPIRVVFAFPFVIVVLTLVLSIAITSGDFWWAYIFAFLIFEGVIILLTYLSFKKGSSEQYDSDKS